MDEAKPPHRFRVIEGGTPPKPVKPKRAAKPAANPRQHICPHCNVSALVKLRLGAFDHAGKLRGGADHMCCAKCLRPFYQVKSYD